jgi:hypothetical protein
MSELLSTVRGVIVLDIPTLVNFRDRKDVFLRGLIILALVGLVVGAAEFAVSFIGSFLAPSAEAQLNQISQGFEQMRQYLPPEAAEVFEEQFLNNFKVGMEIGVKIDALPTPLPKVVGGLFTALGAWVSRPLTMLGGFLAYGIWVMLAAKLLGGNGRLQEFLGTAALSAVPYLLAVLRWVPCLGSTLNLVAWVWSTIIWVAATAVAHGWAVPRTTAEGALEGYDVSWGRALLAVFLPVLAVIVLTVIVMVIFMAGVILLSALSSGG